MSRLRLAAVALLWVCAPCPALAASDAADSAYWDYRIPAHRWSQWTVDLVSNGDRLSASGPGDVTSSDGFLQGQLSTTASGGSDSEPLFQYWRLTARLGGSRSHFDELRTYPFGESRGEFTARSLYEQLSASYLERAYPWTFPLGFSANAAQALLTNQFFSSSESESRGPSIIQLEQETGSNRRWSWFADLGLGVGLGRVRDVTPVHQAQVLEERLLATGALARPLSRVALQALASLFAVQPDIGFAHGRPDKFFWGEVERVLAQDGALTGGSLDLYSAHRALEPLTIRGRMSRRAGWFVGPQVQLNMTQTGTNGEASHSTRIYQADTLSYLSESGSTQHRYQRRDGVTTAFVAEFHHPSGPRWQYDADFVTRIAESGSPIDAYTAAGVTWIVTDRWLVTGTFFHGVSWAGEGFDRPVQDWSFQARATLTYFLEDSWAVSLGMIHDQFHSGTDFDREGRAMLGVSWVISGLFEAPGLTAVMRPVPGGR